MILWGQNNIISNGSFEGNFQYDYPLDGEEFEQNPPSGWLEFRASNGYDDVRWFVDSVFTPVNPNLPLIDFGNGYFGNGCFPGQSPYDSTNKISMTANHGRFFVGFNHSNDGSREGFQQYLGCELNSGDYRLGLKRASAFSCEDTRFYVHLSREYNRRHTRILNRKIEYNSIQPGLWYGETENFTIDLSDSKWERLNWFVVSGRSGGGNNNWNRYTYFDDISLFRHCDADSACFVPSGQICPSVALQLPPAAPFEIQNIGNADVLELTISATGGQVIFDTTYTNPNGLPDFYWPSRNPASFFPSGVYEFRFTLHNKCGMTNQSGKFRIYNSLYDTLAPWIDSTANWSEVPKECCLHTLTLRDMEITGDVSYIVKDTIWITDGVSAAPGSDILIQAGQVVEMDSVEFDGTNTVVEILEAPCQGCRLLPPSSGGTAPDMAEVGTKGIITTTRPPRRLEAQAISMQTIDKFNTGNREVENDFLTALSAYPNPFTDKITLEVELSNPGAVSLVVYDLSMRPVIKAANGEILSEGMHSYLIDLNREPAGIYFVQLVADGQTFTERVVKH
jgi:hypothetical protein